MVKNSINKVIMSNILSVIRREKLDGAVAQYNINTKQIYLSAESTESDLVHETAHFLDYALGKIYNGKCLSDGMPKEEISLFLTHFDNMTIEEKRDSLTDYQNEIIDDIVSMDGLMSLFTSHLKTSREVLYKEFFAEVVTALYNNDTGIKDIFPDVVNWISTMIDLGVQYIIQ